MYDLENKKSTEEIFGNYLGKTLYISSCGKVIFNNIRGERKTEKNSRKLGWLLFGVLVMNR